MTRSHTRVSKTFDNHTHKRCIKCRKPKARANILDEAGEVVEKKGFGDHDSEDGLQSICFMCKNLANTKARKRNVAARIRHHTGTRCLTQLGDLAPEGFVADLEKHLGYSIRRLVRHLSDDLKEREGPRRKLRDALNEGYHIDHKRPLSSFNVIVQDKHFITKSVNWDRFRECWAMSNLTAIPAEENLAKGAKYEEPDTEEGRAPEDTEEGCSPESQADMIIFDEATDHIPEEMYDVGTPKKETEADAEETQEIAS